MIVGNRGKMQINDSRSAKDELSWTELLYRDRTLYIYISFLQIICIPGAQTQSEAAGIFVEIANNTLYELK